VPGPTVEVPGPTVTNTVTVPGPTVEVPAPPDTTKATLRLAKLATRPRLTEFRKGVSFEVTPSEPVTLDVLLSANARSVTLARVQLAETTSRLRSTAAKKLTVKPSRRLLGKPKRAFRAILRLIATDGAGNRTTLSRTISVQPDKRAKKKRRKK
jgi:hypothetical protein